MDELEESNDPVNSQKRKRKQRVIWTKREEALLLAVWTDNITGLQTKKNADVYQKMGRIFNEKGFPQITSREIKTKIANLTRMYRQERWKGGKSEWEYFTVVQNLIKRKKQGYKQSQFKLNSICLNDSSNSSFSDSDMTVEALSEVDISVPASKVSAIHFSGGLPAGGKERAKKKPDPPTSDLDRSAFKEFATEMIRIEAKKVEVMKEGLVLQAERNHILRGKLKAMAARNVLSRERNDILRLLLIEQDGEKE